MRMSKAQMQAGAEQQREPESRKLAELLLSRYPDRLAQWDVDTLTRFIVQKSLAAQSLGMLSKADVLAFVETILLIAPSLEDTKEFKAALAQAPNANLRMLHATVHLPPGFMAHLTVPNAPEIWLERMKTP